MSGAEPVRLAEENAEALSSPARLNCAGSVGDERVALALDDLLRMRLDRHTTSSLLPVAWSLPANAAMRDALHIALARRLGAGVVTTDARLSGAPRLGVTVTVVPFGAGR